MYMWFKLFFFSALVFPWAISNQFGTVPIQFSILDTGLLNFDPYYYCSVVFFKNPLLDIEDIDFFLNKYSKQGISFRNQKRIWHHPTQDLAQKRKNCNLVFIFLDKMYMEDALLKKIEQRSTSYFFFISCSFLGLDWIKFHQPKLRYKLYIYYDEKKFLLTSAFNSLSKWSSTAKVFTLTPLAQDWNIPTLFPEYFERYGFEGKRLRVTVATLAKWILEVQNGTNGLEFRRGSEKNLLDLLIQKFNFTSDLMPSSHGGGTGRLVNGTWTGVIGDIFYERADLGTVTGLTDQRLRVVTFSESYTYGSLTFIVANPKRYYTWKSIYRPLSSYTWLLVGVSSLISVVVVKMFSPLSVRTGPMYWYIFNVLVENGSPRVIPGNATLRSYFGMWFIFSMIIGTAYRSKIVGLLAFPEFTKIPKTFEEAAKSDYDFQLQYLGGLGYEKLRVSTSPSLQIIFKKLQIQPSPVQCVEAALRNHTICVTWNEVVKYVSESHFSGREGRRPFTMSSSTVFFTSLGISMAKGSHAMMNLDKVITWLTSMGMFQKWVLMDRRFLRAERIQRQKLNHQSDVRTSSESTGLNIHHAEGAFLLLSTGLLISTVIFLSSLIAFNVGLKKRFPVFVVN